jgi:hypothetical protein
LNDNTSLVPTHIRPIVEGRIRAEIKANAALDKNYHRTLGGLLEFFDLRELQATIENKTLWSLFKPRFPTKEALAAKFAQLGALRNSIRHTRSVDEIVQKEGEAAIIWFNRVLNKPVENISVFLD